MPTNDASNLTSLEVNERDRSMRNTLGLFLPLVSDLGAAAAADNTIDYPAGH